MTNAPLAAKKDIPHWKRIARRYHRFLAQGNWSGEAWVQYGYALKEAGDLPTAAHAYAMALSIQANRLSDAHMLTGALHEAQGDRQRALLSYKNALKFNPENANAANELRALGVLDDELASIIEGGKEDRRHIGLHPSYLVLAEKVRFPIGHRRWRWVWVVIVLILLFGAASILFDAPEIAQDAYRGAQQEAQRLTGQKNPDAEVPKAAEEEVVIQATARKAAEQKALDEAAARKAAEEKAQAEATARKAAEETARTEAAARKAAEEKVLVEATARKVAEQKALVEAAAREAAENAHRKLEDSVRKAGALQEQVALAKRPDEMKLDPRQQPGEKAEAGLKLSEQDRKNVQVELNSLGHEMPTTTGYFGPRTRAMIKAWQKEQGLPETGYLDANQLTVLHGQATQAKHPGETKPEPRQQAETAEAGLKLSEHDRKRVQVALNSLGHEFPTVTGYFGPRTRAMIAAWQKVQGLPETGFLTADQLATLQQQAGPALAKYDEAQTNLKAQLSR